MNIGDVKQFLYDLTAMYHPNAKIAWTKTGGVKPKAPFISLSYSNLGRDQFPVVNDEGDNYYNYSMTFEINLYTVGKAVNDGEGKTLYHENTAVEDLDEFIRFLDSPSISDLSAERNVTIVFNPPVRDLSELIGDAKFNYRSMAEFTVLFTDKASGAYGVANKTTVPNPSGGGTQEYVGAEIEPIESVEITEDTGEE